MRPELFLVSTTNSTSLARSRRVFCSQTKFRSPFAEAVGRERGQASARPAGPCTTAPPSGSCWGGRSRRRSDPGVVWTSKHVWNLVSLRPRRVRGAQRVRAVSTTASETLKSPLESLWRCGSTGNTPDSSSAHSGLPDWPGWGGWTAPLCWVQGRAGVTLASTGGQQSLQN